MRKKIIMILFFAIIFLAIDFSSFISASKLGISPAKIAFDLNPGEEFCKKISVFSDTEGFLIGNDKWFGKIEDEKEASRNLNDYKINSSDLNIRIDYPKKINISGDYSKKEIEVCVISKNPGKYNGALLYNIENSYAGVGTWIFINSYGVESENPRINSTSIKLTGKVIDSDSNRNLNKNLVYGLLSLSAVLLFILLILIFLAKNGYKKEHFLKVEKGSEENKISFELE